MASRPARSGRLGRSTSRSRSSRRITTWWPISTRRSSSLKAWRRQAFAARTGSLGAGRFFRTRVGARCAEERITMAVYVALLRAINVGGTGKLPMTKLKSLCTELGFDNVRTYIQSGNVVFESRMGEAAVHKALRSALTKALGKDADVAVRSAAEMAAVLERNPFPNAPPAKVGVAFLGRRVTKATVKQVKIPGNEEVGAGAREVY